MSMERDLIREYQLATGKREISTPEVANWAISNGHYKPPSDERARLAQKLSRALRSEHFTDPQGRSVRLMHAISNREGQKTFSFWHDMRTAPAEVMRRAMQQRRDQSVADNYQMKKDLDSYNENYNTDKPIPLELDYTLDIEELEAIRKGKGETA